jgi:TIR domain
VVAEDRLADWDFFISYTQADLPWAEWIAWLLEEDGHRVLIQAWDFVAGSNWVKSTHDGTTKATRTIAVLSRAYLNSVYGQAEWQAAWKQDPGGEQRKLLVFRIENCDRPGLLAGVVVIDLFGVDETVATARARSSIGLGCMARRPAGTAAVDAPAAGGRTATRSEPGDEPDRRSGHQLRCGSSSWTPSTRASRSGRYSVTSG